MQNLLAPGKRFARLELRPSGASNPTDWPKRAESAFGELISEPPSLAGPFGASLAALGPT